MKIISREDVFKSCGCHGFWNESYSTLSLLALINLIRAKNERRLDKVLSVLSSKLFAESEAK